MDARMPSRTDLPESLIPLRNQNAISINDDPYFDFDMERLIGDIRGAQGYAVDDISIQHFEPKTIYISEGLFYMGSVLGEGVPQHETPQREVPLPSYRIGKYPVTNSQYEEFIRQTKTPVSPTMGWDGQRVPKGLKDHPVTGVTLYEAHAYCRWLSNITGREYVLPNEAQWEKACRGGNNFLYPWGDAFESTRCNHGQPAVAPVDKYPAQNEFGCCDLVGNVLQWTCTLWGKKRFPPDPEYEYPWKDDGRNDMNIETNRQLRRVVRGSTINSDILAHRCSARSGQPPEDRGMTGARYGFRVVMSV
jgi:serine/threonine-protein kinase